MRVLITGAGGQLGTDLARHCGVSGDDVVAATRSELDIGDRDAVFGAVGAGGFDVVYSVGAWTAVDDCESDVDRAFRDNALAARWLAIATRRSGAHLVHVSTDYVFDGTKRSPYHEWDDPCPVSVYGRSKRAGELEIEAHAEEWTVARTAWVMGTQGRNMLKTVLSLRDRDELAFVDDQRGSPTFTADLAVALRQLGAARVPGTFHVTNDGAVTWFELVREILALSGQDPDKVRPIATDELEPRRPAPRPANSVLDDKAWRGAGFPALPHYRDSLGAAVSELLSGASK